MGLVSFDMGLGRHTIGWHSISFLFFPFNTTTTKPFSPKQVGVGYLFVIGKYTFADDVISSFHSEARA
jgi:hypothetical protein